MRSTLGLFVRAEEEDPAAYHEAILSILNGVDTVPLPLEGLLTKRASRPDGAPSTHDPLKRVLFDTTRGASFATRPQRKKKARQRRRAAAAAAPPRDTYGFEQSLKEQIVDLRKQRSGRDRSGSSGAAATSSVLPLGQVADLFDPALSVPLRSSARKRRARARKRPAAQTVRVAKPKVPSPSAGSGAAKRLGLPALAAYPAVPRASSKSLEMLTPQQANCDDCGVFTCIYANYVSADLPLGFTATDMPLFRKRITLDILRKKVD